MNAKQWRLILLVSCAHALVHIFELSLPAVEIDLAREYGVTPKTTGLLSSVWRFPFGMGALLAGWLVDRFGAPRLLVFYLVGCGVASVLVAQTVPLPMLFLVMFAMGAAASIYHPAGLALLSYETTAENRTKALGIHGIFGSAGIGGAPFLAAAVLFSGGSWQAFYWWLAAAGVALGAVFWSWGRRHPRVAEHRQRNQVSAEQNAVDWNSYAILVTLGMLQGFTYSAVMTFLRRYVHAIPGNLTQWAGEDAAVTGAILLVGCVGQFIAGTWARPRKLESQLFFVIVATIPALAWMGLAQGPLRIVAAALFVLVHFMHQPIYNTLVAKYSSLRRRSLAYGFSFAMGLGVGSVGATFAGFMPTPAAAYFRLTIAVLIGAVVASVLWWRNHRLAG